MSTRTDWGYFDKCGNPIAVGDAWHNWVCPERKYVEVGYEHIYTGEWISEGYQLEGHCRMESVGPKLEVCKKCQMKFIYP